MSTTSRKPWNYAGLGLISWSVLSLAGYGLVTAIVNLVGLAPRLAGIFTMVDDIAGMMLSVGLLTAIALLPWLLKPLLAKVFS
jgi:uncharacterized membrane protein